jgi:hypothetical protein
LVGAFVIILRTPPFLGVSPLFGIVAHTSSDGGAVVAVVVVVGGLAAVVVAAVVVVAAGVVVFDGVVVAWLQLMTTKAKITMVPKIT